MFGHFSSFQAHRLPRIFGIQFLKLPEQFLCLLRDHLWQRDLHLDELVAAELRIAQAGKPSLAEAEFLPGFRPRRDLELSFALDGRHLDLGPESRLVDSYRNGHVHVFAFAREERMFANVRDDVKIARLRTETTAVALFGHANARTSIDPCRDL